MNEIVDRRDFLCTCKVPNSDSLKRSKAIMKEVLNRLNAPNENGRIPNPPVTRESLLSAVVYSLTWSVPDDIRVYISGIYCDQWCAVEATETTYSYETKKFEETDHAYIQCDEVEYGIAAVWKYFVDKYEDTQT